MKRFPFTFASGLTLLAALAVSSLTTADAAAPKSTLSSTEHSEGFGSTPASSSSESHPLHVPVHVEDRDEWKLSEPAPTLLDPEQQRFADALAHYVAGLIHRSRDEKDAAMDDLEKVVTLDPTRSELREALAQEYFRNNDFKKAASMLETAVKQDPRSVTYWTLLAFAYRSDKQWEAARHAAEKAIHLAPGEFLAYEVLYDVTLEAQDPSGAYQVLRHAAQQKSDDPHFWLRLGDLTAALVAKEPKLQISKEEVLGYYEKAIALQPNDPIILARVGDYYATAQNIPKAIELYQKAVDLQPNTENIRIKLAFAYVGQGDRPKAIELLEKIVQAEPFRFQIFTIIGELLEDEKAWDRAIANYRLSLSANPSQLMPHLKIILLDLKNKHPEDALKELDAAQEKFPNTPQISYFYGLVYDEMKDYASAVRFFEDAVKIASVSNPDLLDSVFYFYYGSALERNGQFDKSVAQFQKALELNPDYADAYNYLGFMYADRNVKLEEAQHLIEQALAYEPENGAFVDSLGWVYYREGKLDQSLTQLLRAAKLIGTDSTVYEHVGDVYNKMGNAAEASHYYQKAADLDPKNSGLTNKLKQLKSALSSTSAPAAPLPAPEKSSNASAP